jgi:hypothetical protein
MIVKDLIPLVKKLDRAGKLQLMQSILNEIAEEDGVPITEIENLAIISDEDYPVWSPTDAYEAADTLLTLLKEDKLKYGE